MRLTAGSQCLLFQWQRSSIGIALARSFEEKKLACLGACLLRDDLLIHMQRCSCHRRRRMLLNHM